MTRNLVRSSGAPALQSPGERGDPMAGTSGSRGRQSTRRGVLGLVAGASAAVAGAVIATGLSREVVAGQPGHELVGTWYGNVQRASGVPLINFLTYAIDGTVVGTNSDHPTASPTHGSWERTGDRQFAYTTWRLLFHPDGAFAGTQKIRGEVTVSETLDSTTSQDQVDVYDAAGDLLRSTPASGTRRRIRVEARADPAQPTIPVGSAG